MGFLAQRFQAVTGGKRIGRFTPLDAAGKISQFKKNEF